MPDVLSEVLRSVRLRGGVFLDVRMSAPWAVNSMVRPEECAPYLERPSHLIGYHMMLEGEMLVFIAGEEPVTVRAGEIVLLPRNDLQILASAPGIAPVDGGSLIQPAPDGGLARVDYGGGGTPVRMFCGFLGCEDSYNPLIATLPRMLIIDMREATSKSLIETSLRFACNELIEGRLADSGVLSRLSELLLIEAVRRYSERLSNGHVGWLRGLEDANVGRAIALIHQDMSASWTAESLARRIGMSRSAFMERFTRLVGVPPMKYLTSWRMETAKLQLRETNKSVAQIGYAIGYDSEEAFSRAFKREVGAAPSAWRSRRTALAET